jgi:hypothetical protein
VVALAAAAVGWGGAVALRANARVQPLWAPPDIVTLARAQLERVQAAERSDAAALDALRAQVVRMADQANVLYQVLTGGGEQ